MIDKSTSPFPAEPASEQSNAVIWDNYERESEVESVRTSSLVLCCQNWKQKREEEKAANLARLQEQEAAWDAQLLQELDQADAESLAQGNVTKPAVGRGAAESREVLCHRTESKRANLAREPIWLVRKPCTTHSL